MRPGLPVIMTSGLVRNEARHAHVANAPFLRKPWRPAELVAQVKLALGAATPRQAAALPTRAPTHEEARAMQRLG
jgi:DNA-binding response OmpR family regulator